MPLRDLILVLVICLVWGFHFVTSAKGMEALSPLVFMILRFALLLMLMLPFLRRPPAGQWLRLGAACILISALHFTFMFWALQRSADVTSIVILQNMYIPMAVLLAIPLMGERAGRQTLLATATAFAGVLIIGFDPLVFDQLDALSLILLSALFQAMGSVLLRGVRGVTPMNFQAWSAIFALPVLLIASLVLEQGQVAAIRSTQWIHWACILYSVLMASIVGHGLFFHVVQRNPVPTFMPYLLMTPVFGGMFGVLVWGDRPGPRLLVGGGVVLAAIFAITLNDRRKALSAAVEPN